MKTVRKFARVKTSDHWRNPSLNQFLPRLQNRKCHVPTKQVFLVINSLLSSYGLFCAPYLPRRSVNETKNKLRWRRVPCVTLEIAVTAFSCLACAHCSSQNMIRIYVSKFLAACRILTYLECCSSVLYIFLRFCKADSHKRMDAC